jgi:hypothetical protein
MMGPLDYVVVGFKGNKFDGSVLDELSTAVKSGVIRVIDLLFIMKDKSGNVAAGEYQDQPAELKKAIAKFKMDEDMPLITESDIEKLGESMDNDTAGGVLVIEQVWAKGLKKALMDADGVLIAEGRVHPEMAEQAAKDLKLQTA